MDGSSIRPDSIHSEPLAPESRLAAARPHPLLAAGTPISAGQLAASLIATGHRRLAVVVPSDDADGVGAAHLHALQAILSEARLPPPQLIAAGKDLDRTFFGVFRGTRYPTGLLCPDAATATAALQSLRSLGFQVPGELTIVWLPDAPALAA